MKRNDLLVLPTLLSLAMGWLTPIMIGQSDVPFTLFALPFLLLTALPTIWVSIQAWGARRAFYIWMALSLFAYVIEIIGVKTGFPYGYFRYSLGIQPLIYGVPLWLPLAWVPLILGAWQLAHGLHQSKAVKIFITAGLLVAMDLVLDPGAVVLGLWQYTAITSELSLMYYSVPVSNYLGWCLSGGIGGLILSHLDQYQRKSRLIWWLMPSLFGGAFWTGVTLRATHTLAVIAGVSLLVFFTIMLSRDEKA